MPFASLRTLGFAAHLSPVREAPGWYWERRAWRLRRLLESGGWSIHDLINQPTIRAAIREQWRISNCMEEDHQVEAFINHLEYVEAITDGVLPKPPK